MTVYPKRFGVRLDARFCRVHVQSPRLQHHTARCVLPQVGEAVNFLRKKGYTAKNPYMELTKKKFIVHDGWCVILTTEQEALIHNNDTRLFNHILVNLGLKDE